MFRKLFITTALAIIPNLASSHSGNTNSDGCHNQYSNDTYHCHNSGDSNFAAIQAEVAIYERERAHIDNHDFRCVQVPNGTVPKITNYATGRPTKSFLMQFWKGYRIVLREDNDETYGRYTYGLEAKHKSTGLFGLSSVKGERGIFEQYNTEKFQWLESYDSQEYAMRWNDFTKGPSFLIAKDHSEQSITQTQGRTGQALFNCFRR